MKGYFITEQKALELGLLNNAQIAENLQKTVIVVTENELQDRNEEITLSENQFTDFSNWFYESYYEDIVTSFFENLEVF